MAGNSNPDVGAVHVYSSKNIIGNVANSKDHSALVAAVKSAGLVDTTQGKGPFTVFVPVISTFAHLPEGAVSQLL